MPIWLSTLLEIVKLTIPALVVFLTVYYLLRQYIDGQIRLRSLDLRQAQQDTTLNLRLQAYERLALLCERMSLPGLLLRMRQEGMSAAELRVALLLGIQQEYDHNVTQQVYVSRQLWEIIKAARNDSVDTVSLAAEQVDPKADGREFARALLSILEQRGVTGPEKALEAVKKEAGLLWG